MDNETKGKGLSRRDFLKDVGVGAIAIGGAGLVPPSSDKPIPPSSDWQTPPEPITDIDETIDVDVVVVGAGIAGMTATVSALENGAKVVVIEKGSSWSGRGGGVGVFTSRVMRAAGIELDKELVAREWIEMSGSRCKEALVWLFLNESGNAMDWLLDKAEAAGLPPAMIWGGYYKGPNYTEHPAYHMFFGGPMMQQGWDPFADITNMLYEEAQALGATFYFKTPGEQLVKEEGRITGVIAKTENGYTQFNAAKGVILATGGIGGNEEMCQAYAPLALKANVNSYYPVGQNSGDGHKMGMWVGGTIQETPFPTMIHPQAFAWLHYAYLFVNKRGERYMNEDTWVQAKSLETMRQPGAAYAYSIFDSKWPEEVAESIKIGGGLFWDSFRPLGMDWTPDFDQITIEDSIQREIGWRADTLEELAGMIDVPVENFLATVARYNELAQNGQDVDFGKRAELLTQIIEPPFYALKFGGALLTVVGGLSINTKLQVLDEDQNPIAGLYAVGNCSGDLYGVDYPIQIPGNSHGRALTWGYLAGKNVMDA